MTSDAVMGQPLGDASGSGLFGLGKSTHALLDSGCIPLGSIWEWVMGVFVGIDVSLENSAVCAVDSHGKVLKEAKVASEPGALNRWIRGVSGDIEAVGLEAGPLSQWLHKALTEAGLPVVLMETRQVKAALKAATGQNRQARCRWSRAPAADGVVSSRSL